VTIFWPDEGLDTGPVLLQREVPIEPQDTMGSLYFDKLFPLGITAMEESVDLVRAGEAPKLTQDESLATYESWCGHEDAEIDWAAPAQRVYDLIRGANPRPGAWTTLGGSEVQVLDCRLEAEPAGAPAGEVVEVGDDGAVVALDGGALAISRMRLESGEKAAPADVPGLEAGLRLGT
jgi:methionyl-tRNA formyltransferase